MSDYGAPPPPPPPYGGPPYGGGAPQYGQPMGGPPPANNLVWAILSTIFCFWPLGIVAIVFAAQVNTKWSQGDVAGAQEAARKARQFSLWTTIVGAALAVIVVIFYVIVIAAAVNSGSTSP